MKKQYISPELHVHGLVIENVMLSTSNVKVNFGFDDSSTEQPGYDKYDVETPVDKITGEDFDVI